MKGLEQACRKMIHYVDQECQLLLEIMTSTRDQIAEIKKVLFLLEKGRKNIHQEIEECTVQEDDARRRCNLLRKEWQQVGEQVVIKGCEELAAYQIRHSILQEREKSLCQRQVDLERSLQSLSGIAEQVERPRNGFREMTGLLRNALQELNGKQQDWHWQQQVALRVIQAQEDERRRIARDIHDGLAQSFANIVLRTEYCEQLLLHEPQQVKPELIKLKESVRNSLQDIRKIIFDLRPMSIDDLGLVGGLGRFLGDIQERRGLPVEFLFYGEERRLEGGYEIALFRIVQEALNNILKHADASHVQVKLEYLTDSVSVVIRDDGRGFDLEDTAGCKGHYGLMNMKERSELLNGSLQIKSAPGEGTEITVAIPIGGEVQEVGGDQDFDSR